MSHTDRKRENIIKRKGSRRAALFAALLLLFLAGCAGKGGDEKPEARLKVVTASFPLYDFARAVAGGEADLTLLLRPGEETHSYEPTPQDILKIRDCDVFLYIGGESDDWVERVLSSTDSPDRRAASMFDCVPLLSEEEEEGEYDEHIWTSPKNAARMAEKIASVFAEADPENADGYLARAASYREELEALDATFKEIVGSGKRRCLVFGDRFPFRYFAQEYGLTCRAAYAGCGEESDVSAAAVAGLIKSVKEEGTPTVFCLEMSSGRIADAVCEATGAQKRLFHSCSNVTLEEWRSGATYLSLMRANAEVLKEALG